MEKIIEIKDRASRLVIQGFGDFRRYRSTYWEIFYFDSRSIDEESWTNFLMIAGSKMFCKRTSLVIGTFCSIYDDFVF